MFSLGEMTARGFAKDNELSVICADVLRNGALLELVNIWLNPRVSAGEEIFPVTRSCEKNMLLLLLAKVMLVKLVSPESENIH